MNRPQYYYLVSGLPELDPDQWHPPIHPVEFRQELKHFLSPADYELLHWVFLPFDNRNLLTRLTDDGTAWHPLGWYSREEMERKLHEPGGLLPYMEKFLTAWHQESPRRTDFQWENLLAQLFYETAREAPNEMIRKWYVFDNYLKNFLAGWNIRQYLFPSEGHFIGTDDMIRSMEKLPAHDFGLSFELPMMDRILAALDEDDVLNRERMLDRLRWRYIDELNTFQYFTVEVIAGFLLKCNMLYRWDRLDAQRGSQSLRRELKRFENTIML